MDNGCDLCEEFVRRATVLLLRSFEREFSLNRNSCASIVALLGIEFGDSSFLAFLNGENIDDKFDKLDSERSFDRRKNEQYPISYPLKSISNLISFPGLIASNKPSCYSTR